LRFGEAFNFQLVTRSHFCLRRQYNCAQDRVNRLGPLNLTKHEFVSSIAHQVVKTSKRMSARANVKWSKILVNGVPLRSAPASELGVTPSAALHAQLTEHNPSYAALKITQMLSWVRVPSTYLSTAVTSSLVVAFEDPDGSIARNLLKAKSLFVFGT